MKSLHTVILLFLAIGVAGCSDSDEDPADGTDTVNAKDDAPKDDAPKDDTPTDNRTGGEPGSTDPGPTTDPEPVTDPDPGCQPQVDCEPDLEPSSGDLYQDCVNRINQFRVGCWCLPALERWTEAEACGDQHAEYDAEKDKAHAGFSDKICENSGWGQNECPGWGSTDQVVKGCLQGMYNEGPPPEEPCKGQCFQDHGHFLNMTNPERTKVACGFFTTEDGKVWAVQNFR